ncbi:MAG TPA: SprT family zinc-dependent metalloprotease [Clostridiaceae bacterium]
MDIFGQFEIKDIIIPYKVKINKRLRRMRLSIKEGILILSTPIITPRINYTEIFSRHANWIYKNYKACDGNKLKEWIEGDLILYKGDLYPLKVSMNTLVDKLEYDHTNFILYLHGHRSNSERVEILRRFYKEKVKEELYKAIDKYKLILGVNVATVRIKEQKTCWGSCSKKGNLNFNWKLILAPPELLNYVVVHELCHLKELNHSNAFWLLVEGIFPDYKDLRKTLRLYESKINNWDKV